MALSLGHSKEKPVKAKFTQGSILRYTAFMGGTTALGFLGIFLVELIDIFFLSQLQQPHLLPAVGFAASLNFFVFAVSAGLSAAMSVCVSRALGQSNSQQAKYYVVNILALCCLVSIVLSLVIAVNATALLQALGAESAALDAAEVYLAIQLPFVIVVALGMSLSAANRAYGDAKLPLYAMLAGSVCNIAFDAWFILGLDMGIQGAAWASVIARCVVLLVCAYGVGIKHHVVLAFSWPQYKYDLPSILQVAAPAVLANFAGPLGNAVVIWALALHGESYVAAFSLIGRMLPVVFALTFALPIASSPIVGQNFGAQQMSRVRKALYSALGLNFLYVCVVAVLLYFSQAGLIRLFQLQGEAGGLIRLFCNGAALFIIFHGSQQIACSVLTNLGKPIQATSLSLAKASLGTLPFVIYGGSVAGANGVLIGQGVGEALFATISLIVVWVRIKQIEN